MAEKLTNEQIIDTLKQLTALELKSLVDAVCAEFGVTAAAPTATAAPAEEEGPVAIKEKISPVEAEAYKKTLTDTGAEAEVK